MIKPREIFRRYVEDALLRDVLGKRYERTPKDEKEETLNKLRDKGYIEQEVDKIMGEVARHFRKQTTNGVILDTGAHLLFTVLIAWGVNETQWPAVIGVALLNSIFIGYRLHQER